MTIDTSLLFRVADACDVDAPSVADEDAFYEAVTPAVVLALLKQAKDDAAEIKAMRESLIHACSLINDRYDNAREIWAIRQTANLLSERFSHERVQDKYEEYCLRQQVRELTEENERLRNNPATGVQLHKDNPTNLYIPDGAA